MNINEIKYALEGLSGDRDTYIHNNAKIQRNAVTWLEHLLQEREQIVEALRISRKALSDNLGAYMKKDEQQLYEACKKVDETLRRVGELE